MTGRLFITAIAIFVLVLLAHTLFHTQLVSYFIAPLILSCWLLLATPAPWWVIVFFVIAAELLSSSAPGAMTIATLLPFAVRPILKTISIGFTLRFFALIVGVTGAQLAILIGANSLVSGRLVIPWPAALWAIVGSATLSFLICIVWYELSTRPDR